MELKCLKCGGRIIEDDCYYSIAINTKVFREKVGHCDWCGTNHSWTDVYEYVSMEDFKIEGE